jgi:hypothetical protein
MRPLVSFNDSLGRGLDERRDFKMIGVNLGGDRLPTTGLVAMSNLRLSLVPGIPMKHTVRLVGQWCYLSPAAHVRNDRFGLGLTALYYASIIELVLIERN